MPCKYCEFEYHISPCKSQDGVLTIPNIKDDSRLMLFTRIDVNNVDLVLVDEYKLTFKLQKEDCPCKDCLVNAMCIKALGCDKFEQLINKAYGK